MGTVSVWGDEVLELDSGEGLHNNVNVISATEPTHGYNGKYYVMYFTAIKKIHILRWPEWGGNAIWT